MKVRIFFEDGGYSMRPITGPKPSGPIADIREETWRAYAAFLDQWHAWNEFIRVLDDKFELLQGKGE